VDIWYWVEHPLIRPRQENSHEPVEVTQLSDEEKKYKDERKAFSILTQALPKKILHQYEVCETAYDLWNLLKMRCEGDERAFKIRQDQLKKEFEAFCHFGNEPLRDMQSRFYHLMNELRKHQINYTTPELIERFADALPPHWTQYVDMLKELGQYESLSIADFFRKLENREIEESRKAKRTPLPQNPDVYHAGIPTTSNPTTSTRPQTAFVSSMVNDPFACNQPQQTIPDSMLNYTSSYSFIPPYPQPANTFVQPNSCNSQQTAYVTANTLMSHPSTTNLGNVTIEVAKEHVALLSAFVTSYNDLVAGNIGNINLTKEDYAQVDKDEMELMDIQWAFASVVRRAENFMERTGRND